MSEGGQVHLAVSLDGAGYHEAAWRDPSARPADLFDADYWTAFAQRAEQGLLDFVCFDDAFGLQSDSRRHVDARTDRVRGRLDAVLVACRVAPATEHIGLLPVATVTYPEPFHLASSTATLDWVSGGRGGWQARVSGRPSDAALVGTRPPPAGPGTPGAAEATQELFEEAADVVEVVRRLWDSWEDDAIIRDVATGRFVDRDKLHYIDFEGPRFSVRGPSIVPRPPQGQPIVAALAHQRVPFEFAARSADVVFVTPAGANDVGRWVADVRGAEDRVGRDLPPLRLLADLEVHLDDSERAARARLARLDELATRPHRSDAAVLATTPEALADELLTWRDLGVEGFRLRPGVIGHDLDAIVEGLVPALQRRGAFRRAYEAGTLRDRLGLGRPPSRYATAAPAGSAP